MLTESPLIPQLVNVIQLILVLIITCIKWGPFGITHEEYALYVESTESLKEQNSSQFAQTRVHADV